MRSNSGALAQSGLSGSLAATSTQSLSFPSSVLSDMSSFYTFIGGFRGLAKQEGVAIDNDVFRLHYRYTVCLLALCSGEVKCNQCNVICVDKAYLDLHKKAKHGWSKLKL